MPTDLTSYSHGRVPRELRKAQVLELAEELFSERGFQGASMDELASRAGVSKPVIYDLVGNKEALFRACVGRAAQELAEVTASALLAGTTPEEQLRAGSLAFFEFVAERRPTWEVLFAGSGPFAGTADGIRQSQTALVAGFLAQKAAETGLKPEPLQVEALAHGINGAYESMAHWWRGNPQLTPAQLADWTVDLLLPGLQRLASSA
jgi:AcrR family transcriptional regulator